MRRFDTFGAAVRLYQVELINSTEDGMSMAAPLLGTLLLVSDAEAAEVDVAALECLARAVLAESTLAKEPEEADEAVAYSMHQRSLDGRWGNHLCTTLQMKYPKKAYRMVKTTLKGKKGKKPRVRMVRKAYTAHVCDYSFECRPYYRDIVEKSPHGLYARAVRVAYRQLTGQYTPPPELKETLHYQYRAKSDAAGNLWFDCTAKALGFAHPESVHLHYRDATDEELTANLAANPKCGKFIAAFRLAKEKNEQRKRLANAQ